MKLCEQLMQCGSSQGMARSTSGTFGNFTKGGLLQGGLFNLLVTACSCIMFGGNCLGLSDIVNFVMMTFVGDEFRFVLLCKTSHIVQCRNNKSISQYYRRRQSMMTFVALIMGN